MMFQALRMSPNHFFWVPYPKGKGTEHCNTIFPLKIQFPVHMTLLHNSKTISNLTDFKISNENLLDALRKALWERNIEPNFIFWKFEPFSVIISIVQVIRANISIDFKARHIIYFISITIINCKIKSGELCRSRWW